MGGGEGVELGLKEHGRAAEELGERAWTQIAERLAVDRPVRSASGVEQHWQIMTGKRRRSMPGGASGSKSSSEYRR